VDLDLQVAEQSDTGRVRQRNEDYTRCIVPTDEEQLGLKGTLFLVADGMGGHQAGGVASEEAVKRVIQEYYTDTNHAVGASLVRAIEIASKAVFDQAQADLSLAGMGTTLVAAVILGRKLYVANVGDSRAYLLRRKRFKQMTVDHSWVEEQVQAGMLTKQQAEQHPQRNLITRAVGTRPNVEVDLFEADLKEGDTLLLCTDGLSGQVSQQAIVQSVLSMPPPQAAADLVSQANAQGGRDNVSLVIVQVGSRQEVGWWPRIKDSFLDWEPRKRLLVGMAALIFVCLCALVAAFPVANQRFAGDPASAPQPAPIRFGELAEGDLDQQARYLNYADLAEMRAAQPGPWEEEASSLDLMPADWGLFLVGLVQDWRCEGQACTFRLEMADKVYAVELAQSSLSADAPELQGRHVRVYGQLPAGDSRVQARLIDLGARWWAWWQPSWVTVYIDGSWNRPVWVYGIADRNPYSTIEIENYPDLNPGEQILSRGRWLAGRAQAGITFVTESLYRLQDGVYVPLSNGGPALPLPTVTLQPTASP